MYRVSDSEMAFEIKLHDECSCLDIWWGTFDIQGEWPPPDETRECHTCLTEQLSGDCVEGGQGEIDLGRLRGLDKRKGG